MALETEEHTPSHQGQFYRDFRLEVSRLEKRISSLQGQSLQEHDRLTGFESCLADIARLQREVQDVTSYTATYDQRLYTEGIKTLQERLNEARAALAPKPKFSFKSRIKKDLPATLSSEGTEPNRPSRASRGGLEHSVPRSGKASVEAVSDVQQRAAGFNVLHISSRAGSIIKIPPAETQEGHAASLVDLQRCVVDIGVPGAGQASFANLAVKAVKRSLLICGSIQASAHVTGVQESVLLVSALQFRMHDCRSCVVYLDVKNAPVIENCSEIHFAPLPSVFVSESDLPMSAA